MSEGFVEFRNVSRTWDGRGGVRNISFKVERGAFTAILGPSGCGKSTTLRLLAGLELPESGEIMIGGKDRSYASPSQRELSMVFQSYALFPHLNVVENIAFGMKVRRVPAAEREKKLAEAIEIVGLNGYETRKPGALSGGQRQRVALARAIVSGHPLCLMDEPLSNLDAKLRHAVRRDIKALQRKLGLTVVYVTHDQSEALSMADQVILMNDGEIEQAGPPQDLFERPATRFAARFIGDPPVAMIRAGALSNAPDGVEIGIRPDHITHVTQNPDLTGTITEIEYLGLTTRVSVAHDAAEGLALAVDGAPEWQIGDSIGLSLPQMHRQYFDTVTGRRVAAEEHQNLSG